jgi:hypothetical protein
VVTSTYQGEFDSPTKRPERGDPAVDGYVQARREAQLGAEGLCFNESGCIPTTSISSATLADSLLASSRSSRIIPTVKQRSSFTPTTLRASLTKPRSWSTWLRPPSSGSSSPEASRTRWSNARHCAARTASVAGDDATPDQRGDSVDLTTRTRRTHRGRPKETRDNPQRPRHLPPDR